MRKSGVKTRDIRFFSEKNDTMLCVHTSLERDYAKWLEDQPWVERYETGVLLDASQMDHVSRVDIRGAILIRRGLRILWSHWRMAGRRSGRLSL